MNLFQFTKHVLSVTLFHFLNLFLLNVLYLIEQVSMGFGTVTAHALMSLEARGTLFVAPGMDVG